MNSVNEIEVKISKIKNLPPLPEASIRIITAVNDPDVSIDELVEVISFSPVLVARLLGLANSSYFGRAGHINELRVAIIQILGLNLVKSLSLSIVLNVELDTSQCEKFDAGLFWNHALLTAFFAQKLAKHVADEDISPNTVYTAGLLLNIGLLAAVYILPKEVDEIFTNVEREGQSVSEQMKQMLGKTQYEMGGVLLASWQLPKIYQTIVGNFRQPDFKGEEKKILDLLALSHWLAATVISGKPFEMTCFSTLLTALSLPVSKVEDIVEGVVKNKEKINDLAMSIGG